MTCYCTSFSKKSHKYSHLSVCLCLSPTQTHRQEETVLPLIFHLCAMQRYANDSSSELLESRVNDQVCTFECLRRTVSEREGKVSYVCPYARPHMLHTVCMCKHICLLSAHMYARLRKSVCRHAVHACLCIFAAVCICVMCTVYMHSCMLENRCKYVCVCAQQKIFNVLSLLAAVGRQSQGAESHYRTSQLPPTRSDAVHSLSHTCLHKCVCVCVCAHVCEGEREERFHACVVRMH